jgi:hypothetical protein
MEPIDATARRWQAWSERSGKPLIFTAAGTVPADYPADPGDDEPITAARLVEKVDRGEIDDERALELAEQLCEETADDRVPRFPAGTDVELGELDLNFADLEMDKVRRGVLVFDLATAAAAAEAEQAANEMFSPIERQMLANGDLEIEDSRDAA